MIKVLDGIRVLDLGSYITAPYAAMLLAEMGAEVIKVERPGAGDPFRFHTSTSNSPFFLAYNRNKRGLTLDYTQPDGIEVLHAPIGEESGRAGYQRAPGRGGQTGHSTVRGVNRPVRFDGDNDSGFLPPPAMGEHSDEILGELGLDGQRIAELRSRKII